MSKFIGDISFDDWKASQVDNMGGYLGWIHKHKNKVNSSKKDNLICFLTLDEYLFKAYEAGLTSPDQIGLSRGDYQLSRIGDVGNYEVHTCRFLTMEENHAEKDHSWNDGSSFAGCDNSHTIGASNGAVKLTEEQVLAIWHDPRTDNELISKDYGVSRTAVYSIKARRNWTHLTKDL